MVAWFSNTLFLLFAILAIYTMSSLANPLPVGEINIWQGTSEQIRSLPALDPAVVRDHFPRQLTSSNTPTTEMSVAKRTYSGLPVDNSKLLWRVQQYSISPSLRAVTALRSLWQNLQVKAIYDGYFANPSKTFTLTQGRLQVTFSGVHDYVSWEFIRDFATKAAEAIESGWLDTFDAVYQVGQKGAMVWVSLRITGTKE